MTVEGSELLDASMQSQRPSIHEWENELHQVRRLSDREMEVFLLLGGGCSNRDISTCLDVTERTVKAHVAQILSKLQVESRLQAGIVAHSYRLLHEDSE